MELSLAIVVGALFAVGFYLMLRRTLLRILLGVLMMSHAANLFIFTAAGPLRSVAPLIAPGESAPLGEVADPVPQALVLTAIVISFGVGAFMLILFRRAFDALRTDDIDLFTNTDA